jgi:hypothetical protein
VKRGGDCTKNCAESLVVFWLARILSDRSTVSLVESHPSRAWMGHPRVMAKVTEQVFVEQFVV